MNSTFKVVFNKARGALMVVNEATSSVQAKGTKTVIAAAVTAFLAGGTMAGDLVITNDSLRRMMFFSPRPPSWCLVRVKHFTYKRTAVWVN